MNLKDFDYWSRWHLNRDGLSDFDVFLYLAPSPLGFFQPGARSIAMSLPFVLFCSSDQVTRSVKHEIAHARTADEKEIHGERWAHEARCNGSWYHNYNQVTDEFREFREAYDAGSLRCSRLEISNKIIAAVMFEEGQQRSEEPHRPGRLRLDFIAYAKGE